jgi:hypothetical protein
VKVAVLVTWALIALTLSAAIAPSAGARRDDLPTEGRKPADGATVKDATRGVGVQFTCPDYHPDSSDEIVNRSADRAALRTARRDLAQARTMLRHKKTDARARRVTRLAARVTQLRTRLRVVYHCKL